MAEFGTTTDTDTDTDTGTDTGTDTSSCNLQATVDATALKMDRHGPLTKLFALLAEMSSSPTAEIQAHAQSLAGARTRGSTTIAGLEILDPETQVDVADLAQQALLEPAGIGLIAYTIQLSDEQIVALQPQVNAATAENVLDGGLAISRREGEHKDADDNPKGFELFVCQLGLIGNPVDFITVIVGPNTTSEDAEGISQCPNLMWTWHPGPVMQKYIPAQGIRPNDAVKLHTGGAPDDSEGTTTETETETETTDA
jgi:hypothetical protein